MASIEKDAALMESRSVFEVRFDFAAVSVDAVQRAAYRLSDRISVEIEVDEVIRCQVFPSGDDDPQMLLGEFRNEVLDQVLRERIARESEAARNVILALAFSQTGATEGA